LGQAQQAVPVGVVDERAVVVVGLGQEHVRVDEHRLPSFAGVVPSMLGRRRAPAIDSRRRIFRRPHA
jgi:hypothetical protein